jgi:hypothetical protein
VDFFFHTPTKAFAQLGPALTSKVYFAGTSPTPTAAWPPDESHSLAFRFGPELIEKILVHGQRWFRRWEM